MKEISNVHKSSIMVTKWPQKKSMITGIKHVYTLLALLMLCLFGVNENAWGAWSGSGQGTKVGNTWYSLNETTTYTRGALSGPGTIHEYDINAPHNGTIYFNAKTSLATTSNAKNITVEEYYNSGWHSAGTKSLKTSYASSSYSVSLNAAATKVRFTVGGAYDRSVKDVYVNMTQYLENPTGGNLSNNTLAFGSGKVDDANTSKTFTIAWCNVPAMTYSVTGTGADKISVNIDHNSEAGKYNTATFTITYDRSAASTLDATLTVSDTYGNYSKQISLTGSTSKYTQSLSWNNESSIVLNMLKDATQNISASATSGLTVSYESSNTDVLSVDANGKLTALAVGGPVTITAKQGGNYKYSAASNITKTSFYVKTKDTPIFTPSGFSAGTTNALKVDDEVTLNVLYVSAGLNGDFTASATKVNNQDVLQITRNENTITIKALREGTSTVTFTQTENDDIFGTTQPYTFCVTKVDNTLSLKGNSYERYVEEDDDLTSFITKNSDGTVHTSSTASGIAYYDITNNKIVIDNSSNTSFNSTGVTIKIWQDATIKYAGITEANAKTVTLTVKKYANPLSCSWGSWSKDMNVDSQTDVTFSATNTNYSQCPLVIEQTGGNTAGNIIATYSSTNNNITSVYNLGEATWTISQAENYKYVAAVETLTVNVKKASQPTCYVVDHASEQEVNSAWWDGAQYCEPLALNGVGESLVSFDAKKDGGTGDVSIVQYSKDNGQNWTTLRSAFGISSDFQQFGPFAFPALSNGERITHIRFGISGTTSMISYRYKNIKVTRKKWFKLEDKDGNEISSLTMPTNTLGGNHTTAKFTVNYSTCADQIQVVSNHPHITVSPASFTSGGDGTQEITVTYACDDSENIDGVITVYTPYENKTISVHAETEKKSQAIEWSALFAGETVSLPQTFTSNDAASATSKLPVTYISGNSGIIEVAEDGRSFTIVGTGTTTLTASQAGNELWKSVSDVKTINATNKKIQRINWNQQFTRSLSVGNEIPLTATVRVLNVATGIETESNERSAEVVYTCPAANGVIEIFNGTNIRVLNYGNTTITASVAGNEEYEAAASVTLPVRVREIQTGDCDMPLVYEQTSEIEFFQGNLDEIIGSAIAIDHANGIPDKLSFDVRGAAWKLAVEYYGGSIQVQQSTNNKLSWSGALATVSPAKGETASSGEIQLDPNVTHIRFVRPSGGTGYHYVGNIQITRLPYIRTENATINLGNISMGETRNFTIPVSYCSVKGNMTVSKQYSDNGLTAEETIEAECGDMSNYEIQASVQPTAVGPWSNVVTVRDLLSNMYLNVTVNATIQKGDQVITWNPALALLATEVPALNAIASSGLTVSYAITNGNNTVARIDDGQVVILQPGQFTITASQGGNANYNAAQSVEKTFTVTAETLTLLEAPTASNLTYGQALSESELIGGSARDSKNNLVAGTFAWQNPDVILSAGENQTPNVVFTPSENAAWYTNLTTTATINVAKATSDATPTAEAIIYGAAVETSTLSNSGTTGSWAWKEADRDDVLDAGKHTLYVDFTPTNPSYTTIENVPVELTVNKANPELTVQASAITYGQAISASALSTASGKVAGTWSWAVDATQVLDAGNHNLKANFTSNNANYNNLSNVDVTLTVNKAASVATPSAAAITVGQAVSTSVLTNSGTEGTWAWDDAVKNNTPAAGTYQYTVHFTPDNANYTTLTTTVTLQVNAAVNEFTGTGDWEDPDNWSGKVIPSGSEPNVIVKGALSIDESITVGNLTIENTGSVAVITGGALTVKGTSEYREAGYGDIHVLNDGAIHLDNSADLQVRHFTLDAKLAGKNNLDVKEAAASGQVENPSQLSINGDAYFQMAFDPKGKISFGWYDFVVPFPVNVSDGIFREGDLTNHLVSGVDFIVQEYSESKCANNQKAWSNFSGTMQPGRVYTITFNYSPTFDQNVFVFKKASGATIGGPTEFATQYTAGSGTTDDFGWNGLGNGTLQHGYITGAFAHMQVYNHAENKYDLLTGKNPTFAIGTSFFVQVDNTTPTMEWITAAANEDHPLYAPRRAAESVEEFLLSLREENQFDACDHLYVSESEEATEAYVIGHDLRKMGNPTEAKTAQMWATKNGKKLCDIETRIVNYGVSSDLNFFAPQAGSYELTVEETPEDAALYLTYNGAIIWDLTASPYMLDLTKGTTIGYGLRIAARRSPQVTTGIETVNAENGARKVLIDNKIYIVTPEGKMYDVVGKSMKQ